MSYRTVITELESLSKLLALPAHGGPGSGGIEGEIVIHVDRFGKLGDMARELCETAFPQG
ncbi:hypothetical protein ACFWOJ_27860 [Streptomyces sp. NPDC058439]|uniref:hypothetical protein n=1 Tax=Streptomyces sp. NPDC058439 TaxID=3346500 RepID=UPI003662CA17